MGQAYLSTAYFCFTEYAPTMQRDPSAMGGFETGDDRFGLEHFPEMLNRFAIPLPESALIVLRGAFPERSETL